MQYDEITIKSLSEAIAEEVVARLAEDAPPAGEEKPGPEQAKEVRDDPAGQPVARLIDHTLLKPEATQADVHQICREARTHRFASVCVNPVHVPLVSRLLRGSDVAVCTVVGFPLGATGREAKVFETEQALRDGATEIDMVIDAGALKSGAYQTVLADIEGVVRAAHAASGLVKVIIEAALLTDDEKVVACQLAQAAGADYVKTSTGFGPGGATVEDVALMRQTVGPEMGVKAAGGIRSYADAQAMIEAGATRLGASAGVKIAAEAEEE